MIPTKHQRKQQRRRRGIPPAPPQRSTFPLALDPQVNEDDVLLVLWRALRDVYEWADSKGDGASELFPPLVEAVRNRFSSASETEPALTEALATFERLISENGQLSREEVAEACSRTADWAGERGLTAVRAYFAEAAACVDTENPTWANLAARACRREGDYARAEIWYERAFKLGVRHGKKREQVWALLGYGAIMYTLGRYRRARMWYQRAATRAARTNQPGEAAEAEHDLLTIESEIGSYRGGARHLSRALTH